MGRGYFGIGIYHTKTAANVGTLWRSAYILGADFIFTIGKRFPKQASDTVKAFKHIPMHEYKDMEDFMAHIPYDCQPICIEQSEKSKQLKDWVHPERAAYILGAEDYGIPEDLMKNKQVIEIENVRPYCMNVAVAGTIIMYDRLAKGKSK